MFIKKVQDVSVDHLGRYGIPKKRILTPYYCEHLVMYRWDLHNMLYLLLKLVLISHTLHFKRMGEEPTDTGGGGARTPPQFYQEVKFSMVNIHLYSGNEHIYHAYLPNSLAVNISSNFQISLELEVRG